MTLPLRDRLYFLDLLSGKVLSSTTDGFDLRTIARVPNTRPDGLQVDVLRGKIYWTCMGSDPNLDDGHLLSCNLDGSNVQSLVPPGHTFTPKQLKLDADRQKLYWSDREGRKIMSCCVDGSDIQTLIDNRERRGEEGLLGWCVGMAVDSKRGLVYWTQKGPSKSYPGKGRILRANLQIPTARTASNRTDIEVLFDGLPEPIDLALDSTSQTLYWTDRGNPPLGNTLNRASVAMTFSPGSRSLGPSESFVVANKFHEAIGVVLDLPTHRAFVTDLLGGVYVVDLGTENKKVIFEDVGDITGIAFVSASELSQTSERDNRPAKPKL